MVWREERRREEALNNRAAAGLGGRSAALGLDNKETEEVGKEGERGGRLRLLVVRSELARD